jgi:P4 family phage/plasmid primase-like protien
MIEKIIDAAKRGFRFHPIFAYNTKIADDRGKSRRKQPLLKNWPGAACNDPKKLEYWYDCTFYGRLKDEHPAFALALGEKSGVIVLDVDVKNDADGAQSLKKLEDLYGNLRDNNFYVMTPSGGYHIYFKYPKDSWIQSRSKLQGYPGIEIKSNGTYADLFDESYKIINDFESILDCPDWIKDLSEIDIQQIQSGPVDFVHDIKILEKAVEELDPEDFKGHDAWLQFVVSAKAAFGADAEDLIVDFCRSIPGYGDEVCANETIFLFRKTNENGKITGATFTDILFDAGLDGLAKSMVKKYEKIIEEKTEELSKYDEYDFTVAEISDETGKEKDIDKNIVEVIEEKKIIDSSINESGKQRNLESKKRVVGVAIPIEKSSVTDETITDLIIKSIDEGARYVTEYQEFFVYSNGIWREDKNGLLGKQILANIGLITEWISSFDWSEKAKKSAKRKIKNAGNSNGHASLVKMLRIKTAISIEEFDKEKDVVCLNNGVINLKTGQFMEHDKSFMFTKKMNVAFDPDAKCPIYERFMDEIFLGETSIIAYMEQFVGMAIMGRTSENVFPILFGKGKNGKSTLTELMLSAFGDYGSSLPGDRLMSTRNNSSQDYFLADLKSKRLVIASETTLGKSLDASLIKYSTGNDTIKARQIYGKGFEFIPQFTMFLMTNNLPKIKDRSEGIWRRVKLIPFDYEIPVEKRIPDFKEVLIVELPGILNRWLASIKEIKTNGVMKTPDLILRRTEDYRTDEDLILNFVSEKCIISQEKKANPNAMYKKFREYCELSGETGGKYTTIRQLYNELQKKHNLTIKHTRGGNIWIGIGLLEETENDFFEEKENSGKYIYRGE